MYTCSDGRKMIEVLSVQKYEDNHMTVQSVVDDACSTQDTLVDICHVSSTDVAMFTIKSIVESGGISYDYIFLDPESEELTPHVSMFNILEYIDTHDIQCKVVLTFTWKIGIDCKKVESYRCFERYLDISNLDDYEHHNLVSDINDIFFEDRPAANTIGPSIEILKAELIDVLTRLNKIMPVQFRDIDCDNCVYNFSDVTLNKEDDRIYVDIAMWHDNLPDHKDKPLKDGRGRDILPDPHKVSPNLCCETCANNIKNEKCEAHNKFELSDNQMKQYFESGRIGCPAYKRKENK